MPNRAPNHVPNHVVVDGSNLATEGRPLPSLKQLHEAVAAYQAEHPQALITIVVDATFGHRIDSSEVAEFDDLVNHNKVVSPPAGAIGRGDAFVLSIANKVNAIVVSNDSYQEFHGTYEWLFEPGRLVGGKPVPHIGWVFVDRVPVRGPISRRAVTDAKRKNSRGRGAPVESESVRTGSVEASAPMPVPKAPPPGATVGGRRRGGGATESAAAVRATADAGRAERAPRAESSAASAAQRGGPVNELMPFLEFVQRHPVGTSVSAVVDHYSSHGAYVRIADVIGYAPLRLMADPAPRSARDFMKQGETVTLVVESYAPARRSIDLAVPSMVTITPAAPPPTKRGRRTKAIETPVETPVATPDEPRKASGRGGRRSVSSSTPTAGASPTLVEGSAASPAARKRRGSPVLSDASATLESATASSSRGRGSAKATSTTAVKQSSGVTKQTSGVTKQPKAAEQSNAAKAPRRAAGKTAGTVADVTEAAPKAASRAAAATTKSKAPAAPAATTTSKAPAAPAAVPLAGPLPGPVTASSAAVGSKARGDAQQPATKPRAKRASGSLVPATAQPAQSPTASAPRPRRSARSAT